MTQLSPFPQGLIDEATQNRCEKAQSSVLLSGRSEAFNVCHSSITSPRRFGLAMPSQPAVASCRRHCGFDERSATSYFVRQVAYTLIAGTVAVYKRHVVSLMPSLHKPQSIAISTTLQFASESSRVYSYISAHTPFADVLVQLDHHPHHDGA